MKDLRILNESIIAPLHRRLPKIAVVGNAGVSPEDNDLIKDADVVVRFNNFATRDKIAHLEDKTKCDILFTTFDLHSSTAKPMDVVIGIPFPFKAKEVLLKSNRWYPNARKWMVNPYLNLQMLLDLKVKDSMGYAHPFPSIGTTALWHMKEWNAEFYVMGFGWYYDPQTYRFQGWDLKNKNHPKTWNHDYLNEVEWAVRELFLKRNNFMFSPSCRKILQVAQHQLGL